MEGIIDICKLIILNYKNIIMRSCLGLTDGMSDFFTLVHHVGLRFLVGNVSSDELHVSRLWQQLCYGAV